MFKGSLVALLTPFKDQKIDELKFQTLVEWHLQEGTHGLVPCGTTGEGLMLNHAEKKRLIEMCVRTANSRIPVIPVTSAVTTEETIALTRQAQQAGANAALIVPPYYVRPSQEAVYQHYKAIHDAIDFPIMLYNNPIRSAVDIQLPTLERLSKLPNIVGLKEANSDLSRPAWLRLIVGEAFSQLSGNDDTTAAFLAQGGHGSISSTANIAPRLCAEQFNAWEKGDLMAFHRLRDTLQPLHSAMCVETNPTPVKYAASLLNLASEELRRPLMPISEASRLRVREAMLHAGLLIANVNDSSGNAHANIPSHNGEPALKAGHL
jgi:4-hydroxy-tetrahydrodipicolinate synthase